MSSFVSKSSSWQNVDDNAEEVPSLWRDCAVLAHELRAVRPLAELPAMVAIAERSVFVARVHAR